MLFDQSMFVTLSLGRFQPHTNSLSLDRKRDKIYKTKWKM
jgi:hypothetical protein